ncbi:SDR family NAD(P)-dependent oxidoreductase [Cellvibrio mixtus]|uniref:SDR family NAD(P)-dependent oxidoreductase n=1 Tax=Cellvibrio mixtus TaxID=39650 RepID=UPI000586F0D5|nr:SDR family NAD(P)-dependent oxidoreductase [Cellvibrio mixtus]
MRIAIIGLSCKFPQANSVNEFWENLIGQKSSVSEIPAFRWDWRNYWGDPKQEKNKTFSKWAGFVNDVDAFDAAFFGLLPKVATTMDPQQRLMLELAWACLEDAGIAPSNLRRSKTGVFCGVFNHDYKELQERSHSEIEAHYSTGLAANVIANRISHFFDFRGPSFPIDTACSSSLNAIHSGIQALEQGDCDVALAGGVNLILTPSRHIAFSKMGMLSPTGECNTFDDGANGYVRGEGAAFILMKPLQKAIDDGDAIYGVIRGSAINHCGATYTLTYPSAEAQAEVIIAAHNAADVPVQSVNYVEAHGTGTPKGDPIEIEGLTRAYSTLAEQQSIALENIRCGLSAVKTNIGHAEAAAGIAGLLKVLMSFKHNTLAPLRNFQQVNHRIDLSGSPFYVVDKPTEWTPALSSRAGNKKVKKTEPLRAGISSFGFGGTNAHIIVEQSPNREIPARQERPAYLVVLSAKVAESLAEYKQRLIYWLQADGQHEHVQDISAGLALGRDAMPVRAAYVVKTTAELLALLQQEISTNNLLHSTVNTDDIDAIASLSSQADLLSQALATDEQSVESYQQSLVQLKDLFLAGAMINYSALFAGSIKRLHLPTYAFVKERYWIASGETVASDISALHPLLHQNTSTLEEQSFSSNFNGDEFFLRDHQVQGKKIMPAAAYIEMACAAFKHALPQQHDTQRSIELRNLFFVRPFIADGEVSSLSLKLFADTPPADLPHVKAYVNFDAVSGFERAVVDTNCNGTIYALEGGAPDINPVHISQELESYSAADVYSFLSTLNFDYGDTHQSIVTLKTDGSDIFAELTLPSALINSHRDYLLHPSLVDGALQAVVAIQAGLGRESTGKTFLPFAIDAISVYKPLAVSAVARISASTNSKRTETSNLRFDIDFFNLTDNEPEPTPCVSIRGLNCRESLAPGAGIAHAATLESTEFVTGNESYYAPYWSLTDRPVAPLQIRQLLVMGNDGVEEVAKTLRNSAAFSGVEIQSLAVTHNTFNADGLDCQVASLNLENYEVLVAQWKQQNRLPDGLLIVHDQSAWDISSDSISTQPTVFAENIFLLIKACFKAVRKLRITSVVEGDVNSFKPLQQGLSGFYKSIRLEKPTYSGRVVLFDHVDFSSASFISRLVQELANDDTRVDLAYQQGKAYAREFLPFADYAKHRKLSTDITTGGFKQAGNYIITGGLGALGMLVAGHLIKAYQANVYLTGRSAPDESRLAQLQSLCDTGGSVVYWQGDIANVDQLKAHIATINEQGLGVNGVIHSAGVIEDNFLIKKELSAFQRVLAPKINGTLALDLATRDQPLDVFVLFSSVTGIFGNLGQCDYGYGNSFEDYFSHYRNHLQNSGLRKGVSVSLNWPYWKEGGMQLGEKEEEILFKNFGITPLSNASGLAALEFAVHYGISQLAVLEGNQEKVRDVLGIDAQRYPVNAITTAVSANSSSADAGDIKEKVAAHLIAIFSKALNVPVERFDLRSSFQSFGFDSVVMIDMVNLLEKEFSGLPKTLFFEYQNIEELAGFIASEYSQQFAATKPVNEQQADVISIDNVNAKSAEVRGSRFIASVKAGEAPQGQLHHTQFGDDDVVIIGISGRFPEAESVTEFWDNLKAGRDCIREVPAERNWDMENLFSPGNTALGSTYGKWGGFLKSVDQFDPLFFNISPKEAEEMDPHERLFLEVACQAIADAGYRPEKLAPARGVHESPVGVYAGMMWGDYHLYGMDTNAPSEMGNPRSFYWATANRVSYQFNFSGPSITIDTACSSSITAIHMACDALKKGEIDAAIAGGVNLSLHPLKYTLLSNLRFLSSDGRCRSFGVGGDGYVPAEAVGAVILKRKSDALRDGDHIYGVIRSTAVNHGGRTSGFTVPNPNRQAALIKDAIHTAGVDARDISYVEAHGTGTSLGDPIEIAGLTKAFAQGETGYCAIGSAKSNIGHAEAAAGVAGLIKILLQMQHQKIAPSLHSQALNPYAKIDSSPFVVQQQLGDWNLSGTAQKRIAALSSFGAGGANGHLIVEEFIAQPQTRSFQGPVLVILSARKESSLLAMVDELRSSIRATPVALQDLSYTLQTGRVALEIGCTLLVNSLVELDEQLTRIIDGQNTTNIRWGKRTRNSPQQPNKSGEAKAFEAKALEAALQSRDWNVLAEFWMAGIDVPWDALYLNQPLQRVSLPGYSFDRSRFWIDHAPLGNKTGTSGRRSVANIAPLVDRNISTLDTPAFETTLVATASYLNDHRIGETCVLPGVAYVEMVLEAIGQFVGDREILGVANVQWLRPVIVEDVPVTLKTSFYAGQDGIEFEIQRADVNEQGVCCQGELVVGEFSGSARLQQFRAQNSSTIKTQINKVKNSGQHLDFEEINRQFAAMGFNFGESFQVIKKINFTTDMAVGELVLSGNQSVADGFMFYPALLDGAIRCTIAINGFANKQPGMPLPVGLAKLVVHGRLDNDCYVFAQTVATNGARSRYDVYVFDKADQVIASLIGFEVQWVAHLAGTRPLKSPVVNSTKVAAAAKHNEIAVTRTGVSVAAPTARERAEQALSYIVGLIATVSKVPAAQISPDLALERYGIDSVMIMAMNEKLREKFGNDIPQTLFFEYQNAAELAEYFAENYGDQFAPAATPEAITGVGISSSAAQSQTQPAAISPVNAEAAVIAFLIKSLADVTKLAPDDIDPEVALEKYGVDSVMIMAMNEKIATVFGDQVPRTLFFEYQDVASMAGYFVENHSADITAALLPQTTTTPEVATASAQEPAATDLQRVAAIARLSRTDILQILATELSLPALPDDLTKSLATVGLDDVSAMRISARLGKYFAVDNLPSLFGIPSIQTLLDQLLPAEKIPATMPQTVVENLAPVTPAVALSSGTSKKRSPLWARQPEREEEIAIVGLAGRYPRANTPQEFWEHLAQGQDLIVEIPESRWDYRKDFSADRTEKGKTYSKWGGFLERIDAFDPEFFKITQRDAEKADPQERIFLETSWECFEDAGYPRAVLKQQKVGVFVGVMWGMYQHIDVSDQQRTRFGRPTSAFSSIANRVSYTFDLQGPSLALDTMCSSSITAIHLACQSIRNGDCEMALAGGVNLTSHPIKYQWLSQEQFLASDGRCRAFGEGGSGYVPGEGAGAVLLKPLSRALADGDHIYGLIRASALNHGGKTNGYTVPNQKAQTSVINHALARAGWNPESISYIEAHGTGTSLGDPIEVAGLTRALNDAAGGNLRADFKCDIGSVKTNIGHLESAAGIAALTKVLMQLKHQKIAPSLHSTELNKNINFNLTPLRVPQQLKTWDAEYPRRAGISSFGAGGSNAHMLIEEYNQPLPAPVLGSQPVFVLLSADDEQRLTAYAQRLSAWLDDQPTDVHFLHRLAYSTQVSRDHLQSRIAVLVNNIAELKDALQQYLDANTHPALFVAAQDHTGSLNSIMEADERAQLLDRVLAKQQWTRLASLWVSSLDIDWPALHLQLFPQSDTGYLRKLPLPAKPFMHRRVWVEEAGEQLPAQGLHPLIDQNRSTLFEQRYAKTFTGKEFYLADHIVNTGEPRVILPGVAYLELVRACAEQAVAGQYPVRNLRNLMWATPIEIQGAELEVFVRITPKGEQINFEVFAEHPTHQVFCQGEVVYGNGDASEDQWLDIDSLSGSVIEHDVHNTIYREFHQMGFHYGPAYRVTQTRYRLAGQSALSELQLPPQLIADSSSFKLHPSLLDAALRTGLAADFAAGTLPDYPIVPFAVDDVEIHHPLEPRCFAFARKIPTATGGNESLRKYEIQVINPDGKLLVKFNNFTARAFGRDATQIKPGVYPYQLLPAPAPVAGQVARRRVLAFGLSSELEQQIASAGKVQVLSVRSGESNQFAIPGNDAGVYPQLLNVDKHTALEELLAELRNHQRLPDGVFYHASNTTDLDVLPPAPLADLRRIFLAFEQVQPLTAYKLVFSHNGEPGWQTVLNSCVAGFAKSLLAINHRLRMLTLAIEDESDNALTAVRLLAEMQSDNSAEEIYYRAGERLLRQLAPAQPVIDTLSATAIKAQGTYLITGGLGKLGLVIARYLLSQKPVNLVLVGRSAISAEGQNIINALEVDGATVVYRAADTANAESTNQLIANVLEQFGHINGIFHSAGLATEQNLLQQDAVAFAEILKPKLLGSRWLDEATVSLDLDFFILFSSISAVVGDLGSGSYACANRYLDAFAEYRQQLVAAGLRRGLSLSINWPLWAEGGMTIPPEQQALFEFSGIQPLTEADGLLALETLLSLGWSNALVAAGDPQKLKHYLRVHSSDDEMNVAAGMNVISKPVESASVHSLPVAIARVAAPESIHVAAKTTSSTSAADDVVHEYLRDKLATIAKLDKDKIVVTHSFERMGLDSVMLMELQSSIKEDFPKLSKTVLFEQDTPGKLATFLQSNYPDLVAAQFGLETIEHANTPTHLQAQKSVPVSQSTPISSSKIAPHINSPVSAPASNLTTTAPVFDTRFSSNPLSVVTSTLPVRRKKVAVIGMAGRFPKSSDLTEFWNNIAGAVNTVETIPAERWNAEDHYAPRVDRVIDRANSKWGGFIDDLDGFDPEFFRITKDDACRMDPQVKLALESAWGALEDSGYTPAGLGSRRVGVFVGTMSDDFSRVVHDAYREQQKYLGAGHVASDIANRLSFFLDVNGPSMSVQTACSSSAVALHLARNAIINGECDYALAGGVNISVHPGKYLMLQDMRVLSPDGREAAFDEAANGLVPSEGAGMVLLKDYDQALADGDSIYGVISASSTSHSGTGAGQFLPNLQVMAQTAIDAIAGSEIDANDITYIECHGTGTALGDPIEMKAMELAIKNFTQTNRYCALGTKANFGHMEAASGICSLIKVLLAMKQGVVAPCANLNEVNAVYEQEHSPFILPTTLTAWEKGKNGRFNAGINSFGMGGSNVFLVVSSEPEIVRQPEQSARTETLPILFSAASPVQLKNYVQSAVAFFSRDEHRQHSLRDLAYTSQVGRVACAYRVALLASSIEEFLTKAQHWIESGRAENNSIYQGNLQDPAASLIEKLLADAAGQEYLRTQTLEKNIANLASMWVVGAAPQWALLYGDSLPRRISMPGYPYARINTNLREYSGYNANAKPLVSRAELPSIVEAGPVIDVVEGHWYLAARDDLNIAELVVGMEDRFSNYIFGGEQWKRQYWDDYLGSFNELSDDQRHATQGQTAVVETLQLDPQLVRNLQAFTQQHHIELETVLIASFGLLLSRLESNRHHTQFACLSSGHACAMPFRIKSQVRLSCLDWLRVVQTERLIKFTARELLNESLANWNPDNFYHSQLNFFPSVDSAEQYRVRDCVIDHECVNRLDIHANSAEIVMSLHCPAQEFLGHPLTDILQFLQGFLSGIASNPTRNPAALALRSNKESKRNFMSIVDDQGSKR